MKYATALLCALILIIQPARGEENSSCAGDDKTCLFESLQSITTTIDNDRWRDLTYREMAKLLAHEQHNDEALAILDRIGSADTKALTIRGIGMAAAESGLTPAARETLFAALRAKANAIEHEASRAIALTYIAMAQAFAGDNAGAMKTAKDMENAALRNKAFAESAEIQAEKNDLPAAMESIAQIDSPAFRDKAYRIVCEILARRENYEDALKAAMAIENSYQKAQAVLYILARQISPEEVSLVE